MKTVGQCVSVVIISPILIMIVVQEVLNKLIGFCENFIFIAAPLVGLLWPILVLIYFICKICS
jgi:hypothetical protein